MNCEPIQQSLGRPDYGAIGVAGTSLRVDLWDIGTVCGRLDNYPVPYPCLGCSEQMNELGFVFLGLGFIVVVVVAFWMGRERGRDDVRNENNDAPRQ